VIGALGKRSGRDLASPAGESRQRKGDAKRMSEAGEGARKKTVRGCEGTSPPGRGGALRRAMVEKEFHMWGKKPDSMWCTRIVDYGPGVGDQGKKRRAKFVHPGK